MFRNDKIVDSIAVIAEEIVLIIGVGLSHYAYRQFKHAGMADGGIGMGINMDGAAQGQGQDNGVGDGYRQLPEERGQNVQEYRQMRQPTTDRRRADNQNEVVAFRGTGVRIG